MVAVGVVVTTGVTAVFPQPESTSVPMMAVAQRTGVRSFFRMEIYINRLCLDCRGIFDNRAINLCFE